MSIHDDLISENAELSARLALAEKWMRREIQSAIAWVRRASVRKDTRRHFQNAFEEDGIEMITQRIMDIFGESLTHAPKYTLERLIDAEIYWETLQKYPTLDALPIVSSYQKILDAYFERILAGFRSRHSDFTRDPGFSLQKPSNLDRDIENVISKKYLLSLGRWYQFFQKIRGGEVLAWEYEKLLESYIMTNHKSLLRVCTTDSFFLGFSELIALEVFGRKRHDTKISYADARRVREICVIWNSWENLLLGLMNIPLIHRERC